MRFNLKWFDFGQFFVLFCYPLLNLLNNLINEIVDMGSSFASANSIHKGHLPELSIRKGGNHLPSLAINFFISDFDSALGIIEIHVNVFQEGVDFNLFFVQEHPYRREKSSHIVSSLSHQRDNIAIKASHSESFEFWVECDRGEVLAGIALDLRLTVDSHVLFPSHLEFLPGLAISALHYESMRKDVRQFSAIAVPASDHLLFIVIVVAAGEQMAKDELGDIYFLFLVDLDRDAFAIVEDGDEALGGVDVDLDHVHPAVPLVVVSGVDKHLVEYFVEGGHVVDLLVGKFDVVLPEDPLARFLHLGAADVGVGADEDVLELGFLLIDLFDGFFPHYKLNYAMQ